MSDPVEMTLPKHLAIVMDGNGRWAERRKRPRSVGHKAGVRAARAAVETCARVGIETLTLFAFSSENWLRPRPEVKGLLDLFLRSLAKEIDELHANRVRLRFIGELSAFSEELQARMRNAELLTRDNDGLLLVIAVNYGGRWDIAQAARRMAEEARDGLLQPEQINERLLDEYLSTRGLPDPDMLIRTGGELRLSNFLVWQLTYTELYFTDVLWPDFDGDELQRALDDFSARQRRFGMTGTQRRKAGHA